MNKQDPKQYCKNCRKVLTEHDKIREEPKQTKGKEGQQQSKQPKFDIFGDGNQEGNQQEGNIFDNTGQGDDWLTGEKRQ